MSTIRHDWTREELTALFELPLLDLVHRAAGVHREAFRFARGTDLDVAVDQDRRLSRRTAPTARRARTSRPAWKRAPVAAGRRARAARRGESRRRHALLHGRRLARSARQGPRPVVDMVGAVRELGLETCVTPAC